MTFASRMQHKIYWGPLKGPIEWSLKTVLAPWAYMASVLYHDSFWYPLKAKRQMRRCWRATGAGCSRTGSPSRPTPGLPLGRGGAGGHPADRPPRLRAVASHPRHDDSRSSRAGRAAAPGACRAPRPLSVAHRGGRAGAPASLRGGMDFL